METNKDWRLPTIDEAIFSEEITDAQELRDEPKPPMEEWERIGVEQESKELTTQDLTKRENGMLTVRQLTSAKKKKRYLEHLAAHGHKTKACIYAGWTSLQTVRSIAKRDPKFAAAEQAAIEDAADMLEGEAFRRANEGVQKPIFQKGELKAVLTEYSDPLTMFLLRGLRPDKYRDRSKSEHDVNVRVTGVAVLPASMQSAVAWEQAAQQVHANQKLIDITPTVVEETVKPNKVDKPPEGKQITLERA